MRLITVAHRAAVAATLHRFVVIGATATLIAVLPADHAVSQSATSAIDSYLQESVDAGIPGIVALITNADSVLYSGAFGKQNVSADLPMTMDTGPMMGRKIQP